MQIHFGYHNTLLMNWLDKINISVFIKRFGPYRSMILIVLVIAACLYVGYRIGNFYHGFQEQTLQEQKQRLDTLYQQNNEQTRQINTLQLELEVDRLANNQLRQTLKEMEVAHYEVKKQLAFYERIMAPEKQSDGLAIHDLVINSTESAGYFRFQVALIQNNVNKRVGKGTVDLTFFGSLANKPSTVKLSDISLVSKEALNFNFKYFQLISGDFTLPEGFIVEQVTVSATVKKDRWRKGGDFEASFPWSTVIDNDNIISETSMQ